MDRFFKFAMGFSLMVLSLAIIGASLTNSSRSADFRPVWASIRWTIQWAKNAAEISNQKEANPAPFTEEAKKAAEKLSKGAEQGLNKMGGLAEIPIDPRLAACPPGAVNKEKGEIPELLARSTARKEFATLLDLQKALGEPNCVSQHGKETRWRFLVNGGGTFDARATENSKVSLTLGGFAY